MLRDALVVAVVAGITLQSLRHWVGDRYVVPSDSMQPTLYGASRGGDVVFVDKTASARGLRRYDLGVFRAPTEPGELVKRVVAFGDDPDACCLQLLGGDLWLGPDAHRLARAVKDPLTSRDLRVPWLQWPDAKGGIAEWLAPRPSGAPPVLHLPRFDDVAAARRACSLEVRRALAGAELGEPGGGWLATLRPIDATYLDVHGDRGVEGAGLFVDDVGADVTLDLGGVEALLCGFDHRPDTWTFCWRPTTGGIELWRNGERVAEHRVAARQPAGAAPVRVEYGFLDGRFFFALDGDAASCWCEPRRSEWITADPGPSGWALPKNRIYLGVAAPQPAAVRRLQIFHDVHWYRPSLDVGVDPSKSQPWVILPPGEVYLLGDNAADSRDSRMFGPVPLGGFVGRPRLVLGPWPRFHGLDR